MITPAQAHDEGDIKELLRIYQLPTEDLSTALLEGFLVLRLAGAIKGTVGLEIFDQVGLLRSLAVRSEFRGRGWGAQLTSQVENLARQCGVRELYLLTTTAQEFFTKHGFNTIARDQAPRSIQDTAEFHSLCPSSAVLMLKNLP